jgi:ferredoxin-NADP reductase
VPSIDFEGRRIERDPGETVLGALLRGGATVDYSCRNGHCLTCILRATAGEVPAEARRGVRSTLAAEGYFLPCVCVPDGDLAVDRGRDADLYGRARIERIEPLAPFIARVLLRPATPLYYHAGQFVNVRRHDGVVRSYSLASVPRQDAELEIHVKRTANGVMSRWLTDPAQEGATIDIQGPNGSCFYLPGNREQPLLFVGTGTGLAPLIGIVRDALGDGHSGPIWLYHGSRRPEGAYLGDALAALAARFPNLTYVPCVSGEAGPSHMRHGRADAMALADHGSLKGTRVFACGLPAMVQSVRKSAYLAGARLDDIHGDAFELRDLRRMPRA